MTDSTHSYRAWLVGAPDVELSIDGGEVTVDTTRAPLVQASVGLTVPPMAVLTSVDRRVGARIRLEATAAFPTVTQQRSFDLSVRDRTVPHREGQHTMTVALASDEALLMDYAPLADDAAPFGLASSLRAVVGYVLGVAIPGAVLQAGADADVSAYWTLTNYVTNPRADSQTGFYPGGNVSSWGLDTTSGAAVGTAYPWWRSSGAGWSDLFIPGIATAREGQWWTAEARVRSDVAGHSMRVVIQFIDANGAICGQVLGASVAAPAAPGWGTAYATGQAPAGTVKVQTAVTHFATAASQAAGVDGPMLIEGARRVPHFHGSSTGGGYTYAWQGAADGSSSTRRPVTERDPDSLTWQAGQSAWDFLHPLVQAAGMRLVCDEQRRWTLRPAGYTAGGGVDIRYGVNLIEGSDVIPADAGEWCDACVVRYTWTDDTGTEQTRVDAYALTATPRAVKLIERTTPYPGPGFAAYVVQRAQGRGREVTATAVADWTTTADQPCTFVLEGAPTQLGQTQRISFDLSQDRMTITARTVDTPAGAIDLLPGTIDALPGTIDSL